MNLQTTVVFAFTCSEFVEGLDYCLDWLIDHGLFLPGVLDGCNPVCLCVPVFQVPYLVYLIYMLQAVVVSIDPCRVYLKNPEDVGFKTIRVTNPGKGA